jgi:hypothetical protein
MPEEGRKYIGPYQRPAPPKRPLGLDRPKTIQKPLVPMHEIQAEEQRLLEDIKANGNVLGVTAKVRKPGRPSVHEKPMTPAERQARRREFQARDKAIRDTRNIGDAHGKSRAEVNSGGYDSAKIELMASLQMVAEDSGLAAASMPSGHSSGSDVRAYEDSFDAGEFDARGGNFEGTGVQRIHVCGLEFGNEESNRRRFAKAELSKMVWEYFTSPDKTASASWIVEHIGIDSVQRHERPLITLTCKLCADSMESIDDAQDHLRVEHKKIIADWFRRLEPPREFRDMGDFVTVIMPRKRQSLKGQSVNSI